MAGPKALAGFRQVPDTSPLKNHEQGYSDKFHIIYVEDNDDMYCFLHLDKPAKHYECIST